MEDKHTVLYTKNDKHIVVGSNAFFKCYEDFKPHDSDILVLVDDLYNNLTNLQIRLKGNCQFVWKKLSPEKFIEYHKKHKWPFKNCINCIYNRMNTTIYIT